jgi:2-polyprenyl-3-methyl-5-hydroxy-6-metoxy-1,4-benzoquinol methylase
MRPVEEFVTKYFSDSPTDLGYLHAHYPRFVETKRIFDTTADSKKTKCVLDIGAHWLHQSLLWHQDGHRVIATDVPATLALPHVQALATRNQISLVVYERLDAGEALASIPDDSVDVVLFCEILEHITFNPMSLWTEVYRVLAPRGRIVVTTPNYYWARGRAWDLNRLLGRSGGGLPVSEILHTPTYGPHWKEYSMREVVEYFRAISMDFTVIKTLYVADPRPRTQSSKFSQAVARYLESLHRIFYWGLHVEIELTSKQSGIAITPRW